MAERATVLRLKWAAILVVLAAAGAFAVYHWLTGPSYSEPKIAFSGDSANAAQTAIVPTLDTPMPRGKNVIWCASFQLAWQEMSQKVMGEPQRVANAQVVCDRLNAINLPASDLPADSCYVAAGKGSEGIMQTVQSEMQRRFPSVKPALPEVAPDELLAYAYLKADVGFNVPYCVREGGEVFTDSAGRKTKVSAFGFLRVDEHEVTDTNSKLAAQVRVLYETPANPDTGERPKFEFVMDLDYNSDPNQVLVARIEHKESLAETLKHLKSLCDQYETKESPQQPNPDEVLFVPNVFYRIDHHFAELEGADKVLLNGKYKGYWIKRAWQTVEFKLDRSGASVASEAGELAASAPPRDFTCDRPFLIVMQKRGAPNPFFVMWVDNAELLCKE